MRKLNIAVVMADDNFRAKSFPPDITARLDALGNVSWNPYKRALTPDELADALTDADVCINSWGCAPLDETVIRRAKNLKLMACLGASVRQYVSDALYDRGVAVISANAVYAESVAEGTLGYILAGLRHIPYYHNAVQDNRWQERYKFGSEGLLSKTVGLMGFGAIARYLTNFLAPFRVRLLAYDPFLTDDAFYVPYNVTRVNTAEELFSNSSVLSVHLTLNPETRRFIDKRLLKLLPDHALFVNTARGGVIDERALEDELKTGRIGAVLDVFEKEPLPPDSPLRELDNVILMPHMGGPTQDRGRAISLAIVEEIERFARCEPLRLSISRAYAMAMTDETLG